MVSAWQRHSLLGKGEGKSESEGGEEEEGLSALYGIYMVCISYVKSLYASMNRSSTNLYYQL